MPVHFARWTNTGGTDYGRSGSTGSTAEGLSSLSPHGGIVRVREDNRMGRSKKDDDDTDSAISIENTIEDTSPSMVNHGLAQLSFPPTATVEKEGRKEATTELFVSEREEDSNRGIAQRRMMTKRPNVGALNKSKSSSRSDLRYDITASGGNKKMSKWKLRKAIKTFQMSSFSVKDGETVGFGAPHLQYFLASLCDHSLSSSPPSNGLKARCPLVEDVQVLLSKLRSSQPVNAQGFQLSVAVTVLKEFLNGIPGGVFAELTDEFYQISLESSLDLTIMYLHSILHEMPYIVQQFTYLLCKALRNLIRLTGGSSIRNYTDLIMHFTPVLFPSSLGDVEKYLRAGRLLLVMVDNCERVFLPLPWLDSSGNWCWHNGDFEDETFFRQIFDSLQNLEARLATDDSGVESEAEETTSAVSNAACMTFDGASDRSVSYDSNADFYKVVYLDDAQDETASGDAQCG